MLQDLKKHKLAYSLLAVLALSYLIFVYYFRNLPVVLTVTTAVFGVLYSLWGITHHLLEKNLTSKIVLEYILVTALGVTIMSTLLL